VISPAGDERVGRRRRLLARSISRSSFSAKPRSCCSRNKSTSQRRPRYLPRAQERSMLRYTVPSPLGGGTCAVTWAAITTHRLHYLWAALDQPAKPVHDHRNEPVLRISEGMPARVQALHIGKRSKFYMRNQLPCGAPKFASAAPHGPALRAAKPSCLGSCFLPRVPPLPARSTAIALRPNQQRVT